MSPVSRRQAVVFTAVPRGIVNRAGGPRLVIGVHVSPRLSFASGTATLADFPDWVSWPSQNITYKVNFAGQLLTPSAVVNEKEAAAWTGLLRPTLRVDSFTGAPGLERFVGGYSYATLADGLRESYNDPTGFSRSDFGAGVRGADLSATEIGLEPTDDLSEAITQYASFWRPRNEHYTPQQGELDADFHERLTLLGDHAPLLRRLGLVVLLEVPFVTAQRETTVQIVPTWSPSSGVPTDIVTPRTQCIYSPADPLFVARRRDPATSEHTERLHLATNTSDFSLHSLNVDAVTAGAIGVVLSDPSDSGPAASSGGLVLAQRGRMRRAQTDITDAEEVANETVAAPSAPPDRYAEHLLVGHHIEIGVGATQQWFGLGHRSVEYTIEHPSQPSVFFRATDEAAVDLVARQLYDFNESILLVSDVVMRWDGWSLAIPRPGVHLLQADAENGSIDAEPTRPPDTSLTMATTLPELSAEGEDARLPTLRYGKTYVVRARAVDITGGATGWSGAPTTAPVTYYRFEPTPTPLVLAPQPDQLYPTENPTAMVVRSDPRTSVFATRRSGRVMVPPRSTVDTLMLHGWFDTASGVPDPSAEVYSKIADLDAAGVPSEAPEPSSNGSPPPIAVPWLVDPLSARLRVTLLDAAFTPGSEPNRTVSFVPPQDPDGSGRTTIGAWRSVGLALVGGLPGSSPALTVDPDGTVVASLPPGRAARVALRGLPRAETLPLLGLVAWGGGTPTEQAQKVEADTIRNLTPTSYVDLVHAVRKPMTDPQVLSVQVERDAGSKDAELTIQVLCHSDSTARLTAYSSWTERVDTGPGLIDAGIVAPFTRTVPRTVVAEQSIEVVPGQSVRTLPVLGRVAFADLRRRTIKVVVVATSRFIPQFRNHLSLPASGRLPAGVEPESVAVTLSDGGASLKPVVDYELRTDASGTVLVLLRPGITLNDVDVEGVAGSVLATSTQQVTYDVPSAVRPDPPLVLYAVPAFQHRPVEKSDPKVHRGGRGKTVLRVYLERPWWSSGDGEQLAVITSTDEVVAEDPDGTGPQTARVTLYGADPALIPGDVPSRTADLLSGTAVTGTFGNDDVGWSARAHPVVYDPARDLYYADVQLRRQAAGTFVRLAVARYQPKVADGVSPLSEIVTLDPVQVLPERGVTVTRTSSSKVKVVVGGSVHRGALGSGHKPVVKVSLQVKVVEGAGADLGWDTVEVGVASPVSDYSGYEAVVVTISTRLYNKRLRVLVEEIETWRTRDEDGRPVDLPSHSKRPRTLDQATDDLTGRRITWVATSSVPKISGH